MTARLLLVSSDAVLMNAVKAALNSAASLLRIDRFDAQEAWLQNQFQPNAVIVDSDTRSGVHTAFERIADARRRFPSLPVIAMGNEMSAQLVLAALRAGATDFIDRDAGREEMRQAIQACLSHHGAPAGTGKSRIVGILSSMPGDLDQDFCLNLAVRAAKREPEAAVLYIDLSLPATQAGIALDLAMKFSVLDAIREIGRLDKALLGSAVARDSRCGLYVMPLARDGKSQNASLEAESFGALLQILRNIFDVVVIGYGPFSRQRPLLEMVPDAKFLLCCNQRFSSILAAQEILGWLGEIKLPVVPGLVIHEMAPGLVPTPADICKALNTLHGVNVGGGWDELVRHFNSGAPPALQETSRYCRALDACLEATGFVVQSQPGLRGNLRNWLGLRQEARPA